MNRFRELRKESELSQQALAQLLGVNQTAISQWERGVTSPSAGLLSMLCEVLNTTSDYLLGITDEREPGSWSDNSVKEAVHNNLDVLCKNISSSAVICDAQSQKMTFDILVELSHVLKIKNPEQRLTLLTYLQAIFSATTHFADICSASAGSNEGFENERLEKARVSTLSLYSNALADLQQSLLK